MSQDRDPPSYRTLFPLTPEERWQRWQEDREAMREAILSDPRAGHLTVPPDGQARTLRLRAVCEDEELARRFLDEKLEEALYVEGKDAPLIYAIAKSHERLAHRLFEEDEAVARAELAQTHDQYNGSPLGHAAGPHASVAMRLALGGEGAPRRDRERAIHEMLYTHGHVHPTFLLSPELRETAGAMGVRYRKEVDEVISALLERGVRRPHRLDDPPSEPDLEGWHREGRELYTRYGDPAGDWERLVREHPVTAVMALARGLAPEEAELTREALTRALGEEDAEVRQAAWHLSERTRPR